MANTAQVSVRIDEAVKAGAERALEEMGLTMSAAITVFLKKVARERRIPFEINAPSRVPTAMGSLTPAELNAEIEKGLTGRTYTEEEVAEEMRRLYGI
jgi:addiction module RelB/DinJ family antitoxin